jgi:hypothetical protein
MSAQHIRSIHKNCTDPFCMICEGGLFVCAVCTAAESELTRHCPGRVMTTEEKEKVTAEELDYMDGDWFDPQRS